MRNKLKFQMFQKTAPDHFWGVHDNAPDYFVVSMGTTVFATTDTEEDARLIVRAVNSFDALKAETAELKRVNAELLDVAKRLTAQYEAFLREHRLTDDPFHRRLNQDAAQAIAKAEAQEGK